MKVSPFDTAQPNAGHPCIRWQGMPCCLRMIRPMFNHGPAPFPSMPHPSAPSPSIQRDTSAWRLQVWVSFGIAVFCCTVGLAWLPGERMEQAFMVMGYVFCLSAVFMLAKFVRDNDARRGADTPMFKLVVWGGFAVAVGLTGWGLWSMEINPTYQAFLGVSWLYLITTAFTLAKMLRDRHEADLAEARWQGRREATAAMGSAPSVSSAAAPSDKAAKSAAE